MSVEEDALIKALSATSTDNLDSKEKEEKMEEEEEEEVNEEDNSDHVTSTSNAINTSSPAKKIVKKRKPSGYYVKLNMAAVRKEFPAMDSRALRKLLAERYNKLSMEEKEKYFQLAREDALRYEREMKEANQSGQIATNSKCRRMKYSW